MESFEPKKLALIRVLQILKKYSDYDHPMLQADIAEKLESDFGILRDGFVNCIYIIVDALVHGFNAS